MIVAGIKEDVYAELSRKELIEELYRQKTQIVLQANEIAGLKDQLTELKRLIFGSKHERFSPSQRPDQLSLGLDAQQQAAGERKTETIQYTRTKTEDKKQPQRLPLPSHLPRERVVIEPKEDVSGLKSIGEEITEELEYVPGKLFVRQYVRPKYAKANGEGVITADLPLRPIEKGIAGPGLLAQTIIDKYCDHLPVYRQIERFKREGVTLASSTVGEWIAQTCTLLAPLYDTLKKEILSSDYLQADETPIKVLDKDKKGTTHRGFHWVYHAPVKRLVLFDYREGRGRDGPRDLLKDFQGYLQTDGYGVYDEFDKIDGIMLVNCFAHVRRKFDQALENDRVLAEQALTMIQHLYAVERDIREEKMDCLCARKEKSDPILDQLWNWMEENRHKVLPKSLIGEAIHYALYRKNQLSVFLTDEKLLIDNNLIENAIRPVAIGRKNYLFAGSHEGARRAAMLYSFLGTCKMHGVNPFEWLRDILTRIPAHHASKLFELLPHNWKP
jgi:transposase